MKKVLEDLVANEQICGCLDGSSHIVLIDTGIYYCTNCNCTWSDTQISDYDWYLDDPKFGDAPIVDYMNMVKKWIVENVWKSEDEIDRQIVNDLDKIVSLWALYPWEIMHDDPAKTAELLCVGWGWLDRRELEIIRP